jgi:pimeloyl-ACP methyl ester carboxylesterase
MKNKKIFIPPGFLHMHKSGRNVFACLFKALTLIFLLLTFSLNTFAQVDEIGPYRLRLNLNGNLLQIPYYANYSLDSAHPGIRKAIVVIHGMNRNAGDYYRNMREAATMSPAYTDSLLIIAPQFLEQDDLHALGLDASFLYWSGGWKSGANSKDLSSDPRPARISSYAVLDTLMMRLPALFPNLKTIVFAGHSAGGQLANRYAASSPMANLLCEKYQISTRFVVANPSSYLYLDHQRPIQGTVDQFRVPANGCSGYNDWRYGLENLYAYPDRIGADSIRKMFKKRQVVYLLGGNDADPNSSSLDQSCQAELQGSCRLERGTIYFNYLKHYYGDEITKTQQMDTVPDVGHDNFLMFSSAKGRYWLFMTDPVPCQNGGTTSVLFHTEGSLKIYPNPANDKIYIKMHDVSGTGNYEVYHSVGKLLKSGEFFPNATLSMNVECLKPGTYFIVLKNNGKIFRNIFVKK